MEKKNQPESLSELNLEIAAKYSFLSDIAKDLQIEKAKFTNETKFAEDKPLSDTSVEAKWKLTEGGEKELRLRFELKALEKLMSAIKTSVVVSSNESKNYY